MVGSACEWWRREVSSFQVVALEVDSGLSDGREWGHTRVRKTHTLDIIGKNNDDDLVRPAVQIQL